MFLDLGFALCGLGLQFGDDLRVLGGDVVGFAGIGDQVVKHGPSCGVFRGLVLLRFPVVRRSGQKELPISLTNRGQCLVRREVKMRVAYWAGLRIKHQRRDVAAIQDAFLRGFDSDKLGECRQQIDVARDLMAGRASRDATRPAHQTRLAHASLELTPLLATPGSRRA